MPVEESAVAGPERLLGIPATADPPGAAAAVFPKEFTEVFRCICCGCCCWVDVGAEGAPKTAIRSLSSKDGPGSWTDRRPLSSDGVVSREPKFRPVGREVGGYHTKYRVDLAGAALSLVFDWCCMKRIARRNVRGGNHRTSGWVRIMRFSRC